MAQGREIAGAAGKGPRWRWGLLLAGGLVLSTAAAARADDTEQRDFAIQVDGKPAGESHMTMQRRDDGSEVLSVQGSVRVRFILSYTYTLHESETWQNGRLQSMTSTCNDNGKRFQVSATAEKDGLRLRVNDRERLIRGDVWTTTYWKLADKRFHNQPLPILDVDCGDELARQLQYVATEDLTVAGQAQKCYHFRVQGGPSPVDLWYDVQHRLVREDFVEQGHRTVIELTSLRR
jgi:hypothetical protein